MFIRYLQYQFGFTTPNSYKIRVWIYKITKIIHNFPARREVFIDLMWKGFCVIWLRVYDYSMNLNVRFLPMHSFKDYFIYFWQSNWIHVSYTYYNTNVSLHKITLSYLRPRCILHDIANYTTHLYDYYANMGKTWTISHRILWLPHSFQIS